MPFFALLGGLNRKMVLAVVCVTLVASGAAWLRWDAVRDARAKAELERIKHIGKAREIENETRDSSDDALARCLQGLGC